VVVRESQEVARIDQPLPPPSLFGTSEPHEIIAKATTVASALKDVLKAQKLISNIQGREYPRCEAWTLLGTMLGVFPVLVWTKQIEGGWEARVEARTRDGCVVGAAEAECLRSDKNWNNRDDYALRSMAQTRATAKALRMPLGFVMTLAGYEATPAEEMTSASVDHQRATPKPKDAPKAKPAAPKQATTSDVVQKEATAKTREWFLSELRATGADDSVLEAWGQQVGALIPTESLDDWPLHKVPVSKQELSILLKAFCDWANGKGVGKDEPWRSVLIPAWSKHVKEEGFKTFGDLPKEKLWWWATKWQPVCDASGKVSSKDFDLRQMLDEVKEKYNFDSSDIDDV
jgi:hypothetical protein